MRSLTYMTEKLLFGKAMPRNLKDVIDYYGRNPEELKSQKPRIDLSVHCKDGEWAIDGLIGPRRNLYLDWVLTSSNTTSSGRSFVRAILSYLPPEKQDETIKEANMAIADYTARMESAGIEVDGKEERFKESIAFRRP